MDYIKKYEEIDLKNFFNRKKVDPQTTNNQTTEAPRTPESSSAEQQLSEYQKKLADLEKRLAEKEKQLAKSSELDRKKEEFLEEWKETCLEIKDCLYDIQDFCDSYVYKDVVKNELECRFTIPVGFNDGVVDINSSIFPNLATIFEHLKVLREDIKRIDKNVTVTSTFKGDGFILKFTKPSDIFVNTSFTRPRAPRR